MYKQGVYFLALILLCVFPVQAKLYKWVDENGQTHFGDRIPPQYLDKGHKEMDERGTVVKKVDAAPTQEELQERRKQAEIKREEERLKEEAKKRDRVLLDTYTTERDLIAARDARIDAIDSQLRLSESIVADAEKKLKVTEQQIANIKANGNQVPPNMLETVEKEKNQLATYKEVAEKHRANKEGVMKQFDGYIARFRELKADSDRIKEERNQR